MPEVLFVVEPCSRAVQCHACRSQINIREPRVLFQRTQLRRPSSVHVGCLSRVEGLTRPVRFDGQPSAEVMISQQFLLADSFAIEAQLLELPPGPSEGGHAGGIRHFEWRAPKRARRSSPVRPRPPIQNVSNVGIGDLQQRLLRMDRDFNAEDYETLLQLDEQHKSSANNQLEVSILLSQLPISRLQASGGDTECSICLENMEVGAEIRTLPCMHFFHRGCIDKWASMPGTVPTCPIDQKKIEL